MENYGELVKKSLDLKKLKKEHHENTSKERLSKGVSKKIKTTMIGAIATLEKYFSFLWENESESSEELKNLFNEARAEILDKGNAQIRNSEAELAQYDISWKKYNVTLPVIGESQND